MDSAGVEQTQEVLNLKQGQPNFNNFDCSTCHVRILESDFHPVPENINRAAICEVCLDNATHLQCLSEDHKRAHQRLQFWVCTNCAMEGLGSHLSGLVEVEVTELLPAIRLGILPPLPPHLSVLLALGA